MNKITCLECGSSEDNTVYTEDPEMETAFVGVINGKAVLKHTVTASVTIECENRDAGCDETLREFDIEINDITQHG